MFLKKKLRGSKPILSNFRRRLAKTKVYRRDMMCTDGAYDTYISIYNVHFGLE